MGGQCRIIINYFYFGAFNFNFYKKNITTTQKYLSLPRGKSILKQMRTRKLEEDAAFYAVKKVKEQLRRRSAKCNVT